MDLNKLKVFHAVAKFGGVKIATTELKMRQSSISTAINSLESELGYKIFKRHYRGMNLTSDGKKLYELSSKIFSDIDDYLNKKEDFPRNHQRITISTSQGVASSSWFNNRLSSIAEDFENLKIKIIDYKESDFDEIEADVFICPYVYDRLDLIQNKIHDYEFYLASSRSYAKKFGIPKEIEDLDNHRLISFAKELKNPFSNVDSALHIGREDHNPREIFMEVNNSIGLIKIMENGMGIASILKEDISYYDFVPILPEESKVVKSIYSVYHKKNKNSSIIEDFCNAFGEYENFSDKTPLKKM
jgi:DNA-binding transcriptional LysR family regulator